MATSKNRPKKAVSSKSPRPTLEQRVKALETKFKSAFTAPAATSARTAGTNLVASGVPVTDARPLTFLLAPGGPAIVKLTLDGTEVLMLGTGTSSSKPRAKGSVTSLLIDLHGNGGQQANITVGNAIPASITSTIPPGRSDWSESRALLAKW